MSNHLLKFLAVGISLAFLFVLGFVVRSHLSDQERNTSQKDQEAAVVLLEEEPQRHDPELVESEKSDELSAVELVRPQTVLTEEVDLVLQELNDQTANFSGAELRRRQIELLHEILMSGRLTLTEKMELSKNIHSSVADSILPLCWSMLFVSARDHGDFKFSSIIEDLPSGRLGADLLANSAAQMAIRNMRISEADLKAAENAIGTARYDDFLEKYILGFTKGDPDTVFELLVANKEKLSTGNVARVLSQIQEPEVFSEIANSGFIQSADNKIISPFVSGWVAVAPSSASKWVENIADPSLKSHAAEALVSRWLTSDLNGASRWLASMDLKGMDTAIAALALATSRYTPAEARQWAEQIENEQLRKSTLEGIVD